MRSLLFVPGDSESKLEKAKASGADALIVDLEDSISTERKAQARATTLAFLKDFGQATPRPRLFVRVNGLATGLTDADLEVVAGRPDGIVLPKAEGGAALVHLDAKLAVREARHDLPEGAVRVLALTTETAKALFLAGTYAGASARLIGLTWGAEDLSAELVPKPTATPRGIFRSLSPGPQPLPGRRGRRRGAGDRHGLCRFPHGRVAPRGREARRDGFTAKMAIHPGQVDVINGVFTPSPAAIARAQAVVAAFAAEPNAGVVGIDGVMYDRPHLVRARQMLARAQDR